MYLHECKEDLPEDPVAENTATTKDDTSQDLDECTRCVVLEIGHRCVVQQVEYTYSGKGLGNDVSEYGRGRGSVHGSKLCCTVEQLGECVDDDENVGALEVGRIPEEEPSFKTSALRKHST